MINNAYATQTILSILLNCKGKADIGWEPLKLRDFLVGLPHALKGLAINNNKAIRTALNNSARPEGIPAADERKKDEEFNHFITYIPIQGSVYKLDVLKGGPSKSGECGNNDQDWLCMVQRVIQEKIDKCAQNEINFNLMEVREITEIEKRIAIATAHEKGRKRKEPYDGCKM